MEPAQTPEIRLLTQREAAESLGCSVQTVRRLVARGELQVVRIGRLRRFSWDSLQRYVQDREAA